MAKENAHKAPIGEELTFKEILDRHSIEIPKIQRDYVQGRDTDHAEAVRVKLLADIKETLAPKADTPPLNLGFVYGKVASNGKLMPLDGQQRLTLLFLIHVFAFSNDADAYDWLDKFSYETRHSSKRFIKELVKHRAIIFEKTPSDTIRDAAWFQDEWLLDPTVQSMLVLLDAINSGFKDLQNIGQRLTGDRRVVMLLLPMDDIGLEDSLYIKLNARGRPLTDWEDYKAELVKRVENVLPATAKTFEDKLDGVWTNLFWQISNRKFDDAFKRFFDVQMSNFGKSHLLELGMDELKAFEHCLDFLCGDPQDNTANIFKACCIGNNTYTDKILLHAITVYMAASEGQNKNATFEAWMRVFCNLALNTVFDHEDAYRRACQGILAQIKYFDTLPDALADGRAELSGFRKEQRSEEVLKAKLIRSNVQIADEIYCAEKHPYFEGNIAGILHFSGFSIASADADAKDSGKFAQLKKYSAILSTLFSGVGLTCNGVLFRRALLSVGDYLIAEGPNFSFCADAKDSRVGWKVFLRSAHNDGALLKIDKRDHLKQLLDQLDVKLSINAQLKDAINMADIKETDWRWHFVKTEGADKSFFAYVGQLHWAIRDDDDWRKIALLEKTQLKGRWHCAGILALWCILSAKRIKCKYRYGIGYLRRDRNWFLDEFDSRYDVQRISITDGFEIMKRDGTKETMQLIEEVLNIIGI